MGDQRRCSPPPLTCQPSTAPLSAPTRGSGRSWCPNDLSISRRSSCALRGSARPGSSGRRLPTLVQFDSNDPYEVIHDAVPIGKVPGLTPQQYRPRGATPLLDALGSLVEAADARLAGLGHDEDQIVAVFTDGLENASRRWGRAELFDVVTARKKDGWTFVFMGANQDSYEEAGRLGLDDGSVQDFRADREGVHAVFASMNRAVGEYRGAAYEQRVQRRKAFFGGTKEAEEEVGGEGGVGCS